MTVNHEALGPQADPGDLTASWTRVVRTGLSVESLFARRDQQETQLAGTEQEIAEKRAEHIKALKDAEDAIRLAAQSGELSAREVIERYGLLRNTQYLFFDQTPDISADESMQLLEALRPGETVLLWTEGNGMNIPEVVDLDAHPLPILSTESDTTPMNKLMYRFDTADGSALVVFERSIVVGKEKVIESIYQMIYEISKKIDENRPEGFAGFLSNFTRLEKAIEKLDDEKLSSDFRTIVELVAQNALSNYNNYYSQTMAAAANLLSERAPQVLAEIRRNFAFTLKPTHKGFTQEQYMTALILLSPDAVKPIDWAEVSDIDTHEALLAFLRMQEKLQADMTV